MEETQPSVPEPRHRAPELDASARHWGLRVGAVIVLIVALIVAYFILAATIPRWWAQRIGDAVGGHLSTGGFLGVLIGLVCTFIPLLLLWVGLHKRRRWQVILAWVVAALIIALPNLFTLAVVAGGNTSAHAGQRTMDVNAPWFRGGSLIGALVGAVLFLCFLCFLWGRRRTGGGKHAAVAPAVT